MNFDNAKRWWRSRTIWLGGHLMAAAPLLEYGRDNSTMLHAYIGRADSAVSFALGALIVYLRKVTRAPIGKPDTPTVTVPPPNSGETP